MSQFSTPAANPTPSAIGANGSSKVSRESLHDYLVNAASTMRRVEIGVGITAWLCVLVIGLLSAVLVDHWLWPLNTAARFGVLVFVLGWSLWWIPRKILPLLFRSIHPEHAARRIEKQHPEMKESLISWIQLSTNKENGAPRGVLATVGRFAVRNLDGQDSVSIIDSANLVRLAALLFAFLLTGAVYFFASPKSGLTSIARVLMPWSDIAPAARVRIINVAPGTTKITQGSTLPVTVSVRGMHKGDHVWIRYDLADNQQVGQRLKMNEEIEGVNYRLDFGKSFGGIHQPLRYWIDAGDTSAGPFDLSVQVVPIVAIDRIELEYPRYTKQKPRTISQDGAIEALEGTRVKLLAHANQPMSKSRIEFEPVVGNGTLISSSKIMDLETDGTQIQGTWLLQLDKNGTNPTLSSYRVKASNAINESNSDPVIYKIKVVGDLAPEVKLQSDLPAVLEVPVDGSQEIEIRASDPDYGLTSITAAAKLTSGNRIKEKVFEKRFFESTDGTLNRITKVFPFVPSEFDLKVGDQLDFFAIATDNRCKVGEETPEPNRTLSKPISIKIVAAVSKPDATKGDKANSKDPKADDKKPDIKSDKTKSNNKPNDSNAKPKGESKPSESDKENKGQKNSTQPEQKNKQQNKGNNQEQEEDKNQKSKQQEKGSGQGGSGTSGESSESNDESGSENQSGKGNASNSKSSKSSGNASSDNDTESDDSNPGSESSSTSKSNGSSKGTSKPKESKQDWDKPADDAEAISRINELREEREQQKQAGDKQTGDKQTGDKQAGDKQAGDKQAGTASW